MKPSILQSISTQLNHPFVQLVSRGNAAILLCMLKFPGTVFAPREGGWLTYKKYAQELKKEYVEIDTTDAVINLDDLKSKITNAPKGSMLMYASLGAYCAPQDIKLIYDLCKEKGVLVAMDVSGSFATPYANGTFADICFASFGHWKIIDHGRGGCISFAQKELYDEFKTLLSAVSFSEATPEELSELLHTLDSAKERIEFLNDERKNIIEYCIREGIKVLHKDAPVGFVVITKFSSELEKIKIIGYCTRNKLEYTLCPREIRVMDNAISIEVKRLETP